MKLTGVKMPGPCFEPGRRGRVHAMHNLSPFANDDGRVVCGYCGERFLPSQTPAEWAERSAKLRAEFAAFRARLDRGDG